jgi:tight adherence protein B
MDTSKLAIALGATVAAGGVAYVFLYPILSGQARAEKRQKAIVSPGDRVSATERIKAANRRDQIAQNLKELESREKSRGKLTLEMRIEQAGLSWDKKKFYIFSLIVGVICAVLAFAATFNPLIALAALLPCTLGLPRWILVFLKNRRLNKFVEEFPNAIDVIVRGVKSGLPLNDCLRVISAEAAEPVRSEFRQIVESQAIGLTIPEACARLYQRVPITEANFFAIVIAIQSKTGGSLAESLGNLSRVLRERKKMKGKIQAMSMEAKASAAIIGALPFIVAGLISVTSPGYMNILFTTEAGKVAIAASGVWMVIGLAVMKKMIAFDF